MHDSRALSSGYTPMGGTIQQASQPVGKAKRGACSEPALTRSGYNEAVCTLRPTGGPGVLRRSVSGQTDRGRQSYVGGRGTGPDVCRALP